jgi:phosphatidylserine decarboxylase
MATLAARLLTWPQYLLPQKLLTSLAWKLSTSRVGWFKNLFITAFVHLFGVRLDECARGQPEDYADFNDFFTRALRPETRPLADDQHRLLCPCDGTISQLGRLEGDRLIQAKAFGYSAATLLGSSDWARRFQDGHFITIYLAPSDYHRVHMPIDGRLIGEQRIPGRLFSVSTATTQAVPGLFTRNERMAALFETEHGTVAVVMVAALLVAGIETVWGGPEDRRPGPDVRRVTRDGPMIGRGQELGRFHWGSTVIVLAPSTFPPWRESLAGGRRVRLGQALTDD